MEESEALAVATALMLEQSPQPSSAPPTIPTCSRVTVAFSAEAIDKIHETITQMDQQLLKDAIVHSCKCKTQQSCDVVHCKSMKFVIGHAIRCEAKTVFGCKLCRHLVSLFDRHSRFCANDACEEAFCKNLKVRYRAEKIAAMVRKRVREENFTARRMQLMEEMCRNNDKFQRKTYMLRRKDIKQEKRETTTKKEMRAKEEASHETAEEGPSKFTPKQL